jgi:hypothetical protein
MKSFEAEDIACGISTQFCMLYGGSPNTVACCKEGLLTLLHAGRQDLYTLLHAGSRVSKRCCMLRIRSPSTAVCWEVESPSIAICWELGGGTSEMEECQALLLGKDLEGLQILL